MKFPDDVDLQLLGLFFQERSGSGGADLVHFEVRNRTVVDADVLGILPADLENGVNFRIVDDGCRSLGRDFVVDFICTDEITGEVASGSGCAGGSHNHRVSDFFVNFSQPPADGFQGFARSRQVTPGHNIVLVVDEDKVCTQAADIQSQRY